MCWYYGYVNMWIPVKKVAAPYFDIPLLQFNRNKIDGALQQLNSEQSVTKQYDLVLV